MDRFETFTAKLQGNLTLTTFIDILVNSSISLRELVCKTSDALKLDEDSEFQCKYRKDRNYGCSEFSIKKRDKKEKMMEDF